LLAFFEKSEMWDWFLGLNCEELWQANLLNAKTKTSLDFYSNIIETFKRAGHDVQEDDSMLALLRWMLVKHWATNYDYDIAINEQEYAPFFDYKDAKDKDINKIKQNTMLVTELKKVLDQERREQLEYLAASLQPPQLAGKVKRIKKPSRRMGLTKLFDAFKKKF
jgi:hypothetical protein